MLLAGTKMYKTFLPVPRVQSRGKGQEVLFIQIRKLRIREEVNERSLSWFRFLPKKVRG